jgi:hypothetical protein
MHTGPRSTTGSRSTGWCTPSCRWFEHSPRHTRGGSLAHNNTPRPASQERLHQTEVTHRRLAIPQAVSMASGQSSETTLAVNTQAACQCVIGRSAAAECKWLKKARRKYSLSLSLSRPGGRWKCRVTSQTVPAVRPSAPGHAPSQQPALPVLRTAGGSHRVYTPRRALRDLLPPLALVP